MAVGERDLEGGIAGDHAESVIGEMEVANDFGAEHAGDVGGGGSAATGGDLFGNTASADNVAAFEDQSGVSGASEIRGGGEAVVAGADDDGVVNRVCAASHSLTAGQKQEKPRLKKLTKPQEKSH